MSGKMMTAKYRGKCISPGCFAAVKPGDRILYRDGAVEGCEACEFGAVRERAAAERKAEGVKKFRAEKTAKPYRCEMTFRSWNLPNGWATQSVDFATEEEAQAHMAKCEDFPTCSEAEVMVWRFKSETGDEGGWHTISRWRRGRKVKAA